MVGSQRGRGGGAEGLLPDGRRALAQAAAGCPRQGPGQMQAWLHLGWVGAGPGGERGEGGEGKAGKKGAGAVQGEVGREPASK